MGRRPGVAPPPRSCGINRRRALALARLRAASADGAFDLELFQEKGDYRR
ncbi:hypothetical protein ACFWIN_26260 [Streptomyces sp. NPDC127049]